MDKIITLPDWVHMISLIGCDDNGRRSEWYVPADLKNLNSDYINEHFSDLQDTAYQRGFKDGKAQSECGCDGCKYEGRSPSPCFNCLRNANDYWTVKDVGVFFEF